MQDRHTVLVVDDEPAIRQMFEDILTSEGSDVVSATDGRAALDLLNDGARPCVILLDLMMPRMNGWQFAAHLQADAALSSLPLAIVAANPRFRADAERLGASRWLGKPVDIGDLLCRRRTINGHNVKLLTAALIRDVGDHFAVG